MTQISLFSNGLVRESVSFGLWPKQFPHKSCIFSGSSPTKMRFFKEVCKLRLLSETEVSEQLFYLPFRRQIFPLYIPVHTSAPKGATSNPRSTYFCTKGAYFRHKSKYFQTKSGWLSAMPIAQ